MAKAKKIEKKIEKKIDKVTEVEKKVVGSTLLTYGIKNTINHGIGSQGGCCDTLAILCTRSNKTVTLEDIQAEGKKQGIKKQITGSRVKEHFEHINGEHDTHYSVKNAPDKKGFTVVKGKNFETINKFYKDIGR
jgi:phage/plasmid primase-like uncharacterized protein